jgi:hypothetical protein
MKGGTDFVFHIDKNWVWTSEANDSLSVWTFDFGSGNESPGSRDTSNTMSRVLAVSPAGYGEAQPLIKQAVPREEETEALSEKVSRENIREAKRILAEGKPSIHLAGQKAKEYLVAIKQGSTEYAEAQKLLEEIKLIERVTQSATKSKVCDQSAALKVQSMLQDMATWEEKGDTVAFKWGSDWDSVTSEQRLGLIRTFADSDACLTGKAREIKYYRKGKLVGEASPTRGVKLK